MNFIAKRMHFLAIVGAGLILMVLLPAATDARPSGIISRQKRVSDQRLAELETLLALARMRGKLVTVPIGFGRVDPAKIGRKRRSMQNGFEQLQRLLQEAARESESTSQESDEEPPTLWEDLSYRWEDESED